MSNANGVGLNHIQSTTSRVAKAKTLHGGLTPPPPASVPPAPPIHANAGHSSTFVNRLSHTHGVTFNGHNSQKGKKKNETPLDPATMYESLKNRIAALEEEEILEEEEERRFAEEAQKSVKGLTENAIHGKYLELFAELKRMERDHAREKQKLAKDKDAAKSQLTKANQTKAKMESLARELQKDNKRLREDGKRLAQSVEEAQDELIQMKNDLAKRVDKTRQQDVKFFEKPDIVVKVVCRYRAELFFKISRKTKLSRLFNAWSVRMEGNEGNEGTETHEPFLSPGSAKSEDASNESLGTPGNAEMNFLFTHNGRCVEAEQTLEEAGMEDGDEILAVEILDLTDATGAEEWGAQLAPRRESLKKAWTTNPREAKRTLEEIFDGIVRERLKEVLRQYELRERHFECVIRSKELEVLLSRARAAEQKQVAEGERIRAEQCEEENQQLRKELEESQHGQTMLIDKLISCCKEIIQKPNAERTQRLFASLREELERKSTRVPKKTMEGLVGD